VLLNAETEEAIPGKTWMLVEPQFGDVASTPLTLHVAGQKISETFDVGPAIKQEMHSN